MIINTNEWLTDSSTLYDNLPKTHADWLSNTDSLTRRLRALTDQEIVHRLHENGWGNPASPLLQKPYLDMLEKTWVREMQWCYQNIIWIDATVVIPASAITTETEALLHIGKNSLGDTLFSDKTLTTTPFVFYHHTETNAWSRMRTFYFKEKPVIVLETFLPAFFKAITP